MDIRYNLTRSWRSKTFEEIVDQDISVRLLKNSLLKNKLFPVYLFSGLRGSGKTSIGRIFAAALNCQQLTTLQKEGAAISGIPCLTCESCLAMRSVEHPDFIEIDAASHTGVDNIRSIIESASFLPVMGHKKIYLIDEAHMLSKAAFNALLKILEEPPATVIFMLATTELHKIPDTVQSRSFQLFFDPIDSMILVEHLKKVCTHEKIVYDDRALQLIVRQSEGSVRDALNIMERVVVAENEVSYTTTCSVLGLVYDDVIVALLIALAQGSLAKLFAYITQEKFERYNALQVWNALIVTLKKLLHSPDDMPQLRGLYPEALTLELCDMLYRAEQSLIKTTLQWPLVEHLLCKMCQKFTVAGEPPREQKRVVERVQPMVHDAIIPVQANQAATKQVEAPVAQVTKPNSNDTFSHERDGEWNYFIQLLETSSNPMAVSLFKQVTFPMVNAHQVTIRLAKKFAFYQEWLKTNEPLWKPLLYKAFKRDMELIAEFVAEDQPKVSIKKEVIEQPQQTSRFITENTMHKGPDLDFDNADKWKKTHMIKQIFPGTVRVHKDIKE